MTNRERQALICGLVGVQLAVGPLLNYFGTSASPWESMLDYGLLVGQVSVLGIWTAYSGLAINRRVGLAVLGLAYVWFWMVKYWSFPASHALGVFAQWLLTAAILLGWRAITRSQADMSAVPRFGVRELLLWMTMAAATLTFAKWLGAAPAKEFADLDISSLPSIAASLASSVAVGITGLWIASSSRRPLLKATVLFAVALFGTVSSLRFQNVTFSHVALWSMPRVASGLIVVCTVAAMRWLKCFEPNPSLPPPSVEANAA